MTTLEERVNAVIKMCDQEIVRQEMFMRTAEHKQDDNDWLRHYDLQSVYMFIKKILTGEYDFKEC